MLLWPRGLLIGLLAVRAQIAPLSEGAIAPVVGTAKFPNREITRVRWPQRPCQVGQVDVLHVLHFRHLRAAVGLLTFVSILLCTPIAVACSLLLARLAFIDGLG